uniref:Uncharacterized protein n=1 Tax=Romanomermis culicivorax TaxID=13658 RepID=A0A915I1I9_ROMCU
MAVSQKIRVYEHGIADPINLKTFFCGIKLLSEGKNVDHGEKVPLLKTSHIKRDDFSTPAKIVNVQNRHDYPFSTSLHSTLQQFTANNCLLTKIDQRLLRLTNLRFLNLADNRLSNDRENLNFSSLINLVNLDLSSNSLDDLDGGNFYANLPVNLKYLNLSDNLLTKLPDAVFKRLKNLHTLNLANNRMGRLSWKIYMLRLRLKNLNLSGNRFKFLPGTMADLKLDHFDASNNPWQVEFKPTCE